MATPVVAKSVTLPVAASESATVAQLPTTFGRKAVSCLASTVQVLELHWSVGPMEEKEL